MVLKTETKNSDELSLSDRSKNEILSQANSESSGEASSPSKLKTALVGSALAGASGGVQARRRSPDIPLSYSTFPNLFNADVPRTIPFNPRVVGGGRRSYYVHKDVMDACPPLPEEFGRKEAEAARFLIQAQNFANPEDVYNVMTNGHEAWFKEQMTVKYWDDRYGPDFPLYEKHQYLRRTKGKHSMSIMGEMELSPAPFRTRCAHVLSQHFVAAADNAVEIHRKRHKAFLYSYWDVLMKHAFDDFKTVLVKTSKHPLMALFLDLASNVNEQVEALERLRESGQTLTDMGSLPSENFAREVMELFTLGPHQLNDDGTPVLVDGQLAPNYTEEDVVSLGHAFSGWYFPFKRREPTEFIASDPIAHETRELTFLGVTLPAGHTAEHAFDVVMDTLVNHRNCAPFVSLNLIRKFVKSNPSPQYVLDVVSVFRSTNGNLGEVYKAILLHPEARRPELSDVKTAGRLKEFQAVSYQLTRFRRAKGTWEATGFPKGPRVFAAPLTSGSVFNFFSANYTPDVGPINDYNQTAATPVIAPESELLREADLLRFYQYMIRLFPREIKTIPFGGDLDRCSDLDKIPQLVRGLNVYLTGGQIPLHQEKEIIDEVIKGFILRVKHVNKQKTQRVILALALVAFNPYFLYSI